MLPKTLRNGLFDRMSTKTMRYIESVPNKAATGLVRRVYDQIQEDFFMNGSLTSHSRVPDLLAGVWTGGRETILVPDRLDKTTKFAMTATLSRFNDCPYCGDMLVSLVHGSGEHEAAGQIFSEIEDQIADPKLRERLAWVAAVVTSGHDRPAPFMPEELPEAIGSLLAMSHINRFSHVAMDGSPVTAPLGMQRVKAAELRVFGSELRDTSQLEIEPGRSLSLLPEAPLPDDLAWALPNPRIAAALARWAAAIDRQTALAVSDSARAVIEDRLRQWDGDRMPLSRNWVDQEIAGLQGKDRDIARFALVAAKASYQVDGALVAGVMGPEGDQKRLTRVLAWAAFSAARRVAELTAKAATRPSNAVEVAA
jgi:hypothetical protein